MRDICGHHGWRTRGWNTNGTIVEHQWIAYWNRRYLTRRNAAQRALGTTPEFVDGQVSESVVRCEGQYEQTVAGSK